ncbi:type VI secretion system protein TssA [Desulfobacter curvatus]|uniref:type VI secretion system protein TssA n=1 Tax=Desulfobacter curvatus TaxID=2290 RepID=UPI0003800AD5|nr:type VI secretion system protein TssA [Desulfobacter curvatus]
MSILNFDKLLAPVTEENPCGEDLSDLTEYYILEEHAKGKEETQFSEAEPPDWQQAEALAKKLLLQGKEMWVIFHLVCAMTANHGTSGLNEGFRFLLEVMTAFWDDIFPEPDLDDANPFEQRMEVLQSLSSMTSPLLNNIRSMPICKSRQIGAFSYRDVLISQGEIKAAKDETPAEKNLIEAAIRDTDPEFTAQMIFSLKETLQHIRDIETFLTETAGQKRNGSNIQHIENTIESILTFVEPYTGTRVEEESDTDKETISGDTEDPADAGVQETLNSRDDVYALLGEMVQWYEQNEPASPVAMLLNRAKSLVGKNFFQIISHVLGPVPQINALFGPPEEYPDIESLPAGRQSGFHIQSRKDILDWLDKTTKWYGNFEPSSPVPFFLHRARQLVGKNFQEILGKIADEALLKNVEELLNNKIIK